MPPPFFPMLASLLDAPLDSTTLAYEPKYDGIRALVEVSPRDVRLWSRLGNVAGLAGSLFGTDFNSFLWPFHHGGGLGGMLNAAVMTGVVLALTALLTRAGLRLKL